jgi:hypothetical protein
MRAAAPRNGAVTTNCCESCRVWRTILSGTTVNRGHTKACCSNNYLGVFVILGDLWVL